MFTLAMAQPAAHGGEGDVNHDFTLKRADRHDRSAENDATTLTADGVIGGAGGLTKTGGERLNDEIETASGITVNAGRERWHSQRPATWEKSTVTVGTRRQRGRR